LWLGVYVLKVYVLKVYVLRVSLAETVGVSAAGCDAVCLSLTFRAVGVFGLDGSAIGALFLPRAATAPRHFTVVDDMGLLYTKIRRD
jgi:hypothetical protein